MLISAVARQNGYETYLCDLNHEDPVRKVTSLKPDIIAYSSSTGEAKHYIRANQRIKQESPQIFTIMGGPHPTFYPDFLHQTTLDAICIGEGEGAFRDLLCSLSAGHSVNGIPNIQTREHPVIDLRNLVEDLDSVPFPDYALIYDNTPMGDYPLKSFITSMGCPFNCAYCFNHAWRQLYSGKGKIVRRHSVDWVIESIERVRKRWPLSNVKFYDDIFCYRADDWLEEFSRKYKQAINLPFFILTRADLLTEDMVKLLKAAGCRTISMSIEAGNPKIRNEVLNRRMSDKQIIKAHQLCQKYGIYTFTNCIVGLPGATFEDEVSSIDLCLKSRVDWAEFPIFYPYPGTELGNKAIEMGLYTPDYETMHTSYMYRSPLSCFSEKEKNLQMNLAALAPVVAALPFLRNLVINHLLHRPHNRIFTLLYYLVKMRIIRGKIYQTKTNLRESLKIFIRSLRQELFRHESPDESI